MHFRTTGLSPDPFRPLWGLADEELRSRGILRVTADRSPGYPDRIEMREAVPGETLLLLNHVHQPVASPYYGRHAIYVREGAEQRWDRVDEVPEVMRNRLLAVRGFDDAGMIVDAQVIEGAVLERAIERLFAQSAIDHIDVHNAARGCFSGRIDRA